MTQKPWNMKPGPIELPQRRWWVYVSFKVDGVLMGGVVVYAHNVHEAANFAAAYGVRGEVLGMVIDDDIQIDRKFRECLMTVEECKQFELDVRRQAGLRAK